MRPSPPAPAWHAPKRRTTANRREARAADAETLRYEYGQAVRATGPAARLVRFGTGRRPARPQANGTRSLDPTVRPPTAPGRRARTLRLAATLALITALTALAALAGCASLPQYTGTLAVVGSAPRNVKLVLVTAAARYEIVGELVDELWQRQGRRVVVRGVVVRRALGPGFPAHLEVHGIEQ